MNIQELEERYTPDNIQNQRILEQTYKITEEAILNFQNIIETFKEGKYRIFNQDNYPSEEVNDNTICFIYTE